MKTARYLLGSILAMGGILLGMPVSFAQTVTAASLSPDISTIQSDISTLQGEINTDITNLSNDLKNEETYQAAISLDKASGDSATTIASEQALLTQAETAKQAATQALNLVETTRAADVKLLAALNNTQSIITKRTTVLQAKTNLKGIQAQVKVNTEILRFDEQIGNTSAATGLESTITSEETTELQDSTTLKQDRSALNKMVNKPQADSIPLRIILRNAKVHA